jgi:hypothetical protein
MCYSNQSIFYYHLVIEHSHGKSPFLIGKPFINGPFSMAMLNNQRVDVLLGEVYQTCGDMIPRCLMPQPR